MSAAQAREQLEAAIWRAARCGPSRKPEHVLAAMAFADNYADQAADERAAGHVTERMAGRGRLAAVTAEYYGARR